jgi:oxygen-dependent protoporphyrinogen oxidase
VPRVAVIGAGLAGLACAHRLLTPTGGDVVVLEASDRVGGYLRTSSHGTYVVESGPNGFLDNAPDTLALVRELGLTGELLPSQDRARRRFVFRDGRLRLLPGSPVAFLRSDVLSGAAKLRILSEPFAQKPRDEDETIHAFAARRLGAEAADVLVDPMVSGIFAGDARQLSLRAAFPKMWELEREHGGLFRALLARRRKVKASGAPVGSPLGSLTSFRNGVESLPRALRSALGDRVRTRTRVVGVSQAGAGWTVALDSGEAFHTEHVVIATSPAAAANLLAPLDTTLATTLVQIPSAPIAVVALGFDVESLRHPLDGFGFLVPRRQGPRILGALWESSVYEGRAGEGQALIRVMAGGAHDPGFVSLADDEAIGLVRRDLRATMGVTADPQVAIVIRHHEGIPQYTVGHLDRVAAIEAALSRWPGLHLAGHGYRGVGINHVIANARALADRLPSR